MTTQSKAQVEDRIAEIRARLAACTQGTWRSVPHFDDEDCDDEWRIHYDDSGLWLATVHLGACAEAPEIAEGQATAALIANAPGDLAWALDLVTRLTEERDRLKAERDKFEQSYRCYSCKRWFEEDHGHGLASEHFGDWLKGDRPKCEDCLRGTATWGGGPHDPFYRVRKETYDALTSENKRLKEALAKCASRFREYETSHAAKGSVDGDAKARRNAEMAEMCEVALQQSQEKSS